MQVYLFLNSFIYLVFSAWCLVKPAETAGFLGLGFLNNSGKTEYLSVYSGMELGFAVFLFFCALSPQMRFAGLVFCVSMYIGLMVVRPVCAIVYGNIGRATYIIGSLEYILGIWGIILLFNELKK